MAGSVFTVEDPPVSEVQGAKAYVRYSTHTGAAIVADSYGIDSVVRNSTGNATINITPGTFPDGNYTVVAGVGGAGFGGGGPFPVSIQAPQALTTPTATTLTVQTSGSTGGVADAEYVSLAFYHT